MRLGVEEVKTGSKLRKTAEKFGVPVMILHDRKKGSEYKPENRDDLIKLSKMFHGLTP